ncbi:type IX secretion system motor protein PorL/GldL [Natronoflexus pectinivorans]|uniref:Gliding motility-associated protein GldL n=1 Tax=Natronoflexus pectinivorans TaxID=682526 RepID=A0A4R2GI41_9BACT|nr:gliding motility protein GldL [Natronoflexus pectinivorans]TCO08207.1 gliding motility-associated protein GldL [Natronoflexus pectinivorans]
MSGSGFFGSPAYKKIMAKTYGIGASVVILGALWKILHWPGADYMLMAGLGTEALIFFLSAFEPPHEMPDWSLVYPELVGLEPRESKVSLNAGGGGIAVGGGGGSELAALIQGGHLDVSTVEKLSEGIKKLSQTASSLSNLSEASMATEAYLQAMKTASDSVGSFAGVSSKLGESAESLASSFVNTAQSVSSSGTQFSQKLSATGDSFVDVLKESGDKLVQSYQSLGESMASQVEKVSGDSVKYTEGLSVANQKLAAINSAYELQLSSINDQVQSSQQLTKSLGDITQHMNQSVSDTAAYKQEVANLTKTLGDLNSIYGNMLSAMSVGGNK